MTDYNRLADMCTDLLNAAVDSLTPEPLNPNDPRQGAPANRFLSHGIPVAECDQLTVHFAPARNIGAPNRSGSGLGPTGCAVIPVGVFVVSLFRCVPGMNSDGNTSNEELNKSAAALLVDGYALFDGLSTKWLEGNLFPSQPDMGCEAINWTPGLQTLTPNGELGGWTVSFEAQF